MLVVLLALVVAVNTPTTGRAEAVNGPSLVISQLKITSSNGQFVTLYNTTDSTLDMSHYRLEYFNNFDLDKASSSRLIALSGTVPPHGYFMVSDDMLTLCYRMAVDSASLGFSATSGFIDITAEMQAAPGGAVLPVIDDYVGWSKTSAAGAQTLPTNTSAFLQRQPLNAAHDPVIASAGAGSWQAVRPDETNACGLVKDSDGTTTAPAGLMQLLSADAPPATIIAANVSTPGKPAPSIPASDIGLKAPVVNELLPNPVGTGNDKTNEYIELYNANAASFDLSGFGLQTGLTSTHTYIFPAGTKLPGHGFTAFYSSATKLSLSNTSSRVVLLDPFGNSISASTTYATAKDGNAWALAKGKWYWTTDPTPGRANIIKQPPVSGKKASAKTKKSGKVTGTASLKNVKTTGSSAGTFGASDGSDSIPVHTWILAVIAGLALLYGAYEYRADMANYFHRIRNNTQASREDRR